MISLGVKVLLELAVLREISCFLSISWRDQIAGSMLKNLLLIPLLIDAVTLNSTVPSIVYFSVSQTFLFHRPLFTLDTSFSPPKPHKANTR